MAKQQQLYDPNAPQTPERTRQIRKAGLLLGLAGLGGLAIAYFVAGSLLEVPLLLLIFLGLAAVVGLIQAATGRALLKPRPPA